MVKLPPAGRNVDLRVLIPGLLRSYTAGAAEISLVLASGAESARVDDALRALDARFPGLRFRLVDEQGNVRPHIRLFLDRTEARALSTPVVAGQTLMIVGALSGG